MKNTYSNNLTLSQVIVELRTEIYNISNELFGTNEGELNNLTKFLRNLIKCDTIKTNSIIFVLGVSNDIIVKFFKSISMVMENFLQLKKKLSCSEFPNSSYKIILRNENEKRF